MNKTQRLETNKPVIIERFLEKTFLRREFLGKIKCNKLGIKICDDSQSKVT